MSSGKFVLVQGDDDNFDKIMAAVGLTAEQMALSRKTKPTMEWTKDGDTYKTMVTAPGMPERHQTFKLDVEFEEVAIGNRKVKTTFKKVGDVLVQHEKQADGQVVIYERQVNGDEMHCKVSLGNMVANRVYKRM